MPHPSDKAGVHYLGVAPVEFDGRGEAIISRQHLRFAPEFGGHSMSYFRGNPEGLANTGADFDDGDIISFGDESEGWTYYDSLGGIPSMDDVYAESLGNIPSMDDVYSESLGNIPSMDVYAESLGAAPKPLTPKQAKRYLKAAVAAPTSTRSYFIVHVIAPTKAVAKTMASIRVKSKSKWKNKANLNKSKWQVGAPSGLIPSPGILPWAPHIPLPPPLMPIPVWKVRIPKKGSNTLKSTSAPKPGVSAAQAGVTTMMDRMVWENRNPEAPRGAVAKVSDWKQLSAEQEYAQDQGIPQNLPYGGLTYPGGEGDSYNADPYVNDWEEQGVNQDRYDQAVAQLLADEFGDNPYGLSDTSADLPPVDLLSEQLLWDSAFGGDVYNEGSGILYDGYQDGEAMTARQMHALKDPADVNFGADPYSNYFGRGCGC